jgi:hypothetical protein
MKIAAITPTRGDRPQFIKHCKYLMAQQTVKPDLHIILDAIPENNEIDLVKRIKIGVALAKVQGYDYIFIIEDDDFYHKTYIENTLKHVKANPEKSIFGYGSSIYYNLKLQKSRTWVHPTHSSLYLTSFRASALNDFTFPEPNTPNLDLHLWKYATTQQKSHIISEQSKCLGIKHGIGLTGGNGHTSQFYCGTPSQKELIVCDKQSLQFYKSLM